MNGAPVGPGELPFGLLFLGFALWLYTHLGSEARWIARLPWFQQPALWPAIAIHGMLAFGVVNLFASLIALGSERDRREMLTWLRALEYVGWYLAYAWAVGQIGYLPATMPRCCCWSGGWASPPAPDAVLGRWPFRWWWWWCSSRSCASASPAGGFMRCFRPTGSASCRSISEGKRPMDTLLSAIEILARWEVMAALLIGSVGGVIIGAIPGVGPPVAIAILLPATFAFDPIVGLTALLGIYGSSMYGGAIPAILINTPGTPVNALTTYNGYPMTQRGQARARWGWPMARRSCRHVLGALPDPAGAGAGQDRADVRLARDLPRRASGHRAGVSRIAGRCWRRA
jgi:hypothetical protein